MAKKLRITISRIFIVLLLFLICFSSRLLEEKAPFVTSMLFFSGAILVGAASIGRAWCSLYIAGYKTDKLITQGPYSMCRNPLYFFSFLGAIGVGFATETLLIPLIVFFAFAIYYPFVIKSEEKRLMEVHGNEFEVYLKNVPCFFPKISLLKEPEEYITRPITFRKSALDGLGFIWLLGLLEVIEEINELNIIPTLFEIF